MNINTEKIHLFLLNCAVVEREVRAIQGAFATASPRLDTELDSDQLPDFIRQFELENRMNAAKMATYYKLFYMLENDIRDLVSETLEAAHGKDWWSKCVPQGVKDEADKNRDREELQGITSRSERQIDYSNFGQLADIIRANWKDFAGMLSNQPAMSRVLSQLNMLRGPIAHCGVLAEDEVDRLKLSIKDWFRVMAGPKKA